MTAAIAIEDILGRYRRTVTNEEAGLAMLALMVHRRKGAEQPLSPKTIEVLLALAVEHHQPRPKP